ncbi:unnamed protein product [Brassicogethes aeneus]|uniref:Uncharacterized protein n=1 Tax=Brassicogethes aeneus TaxID=1431903 RepID=A0A9P0FLV2_BRAAE|nr:unnamed protein product [Brassicogethes aeneus]
MIRYSKLKGFVAFRQYILAFHKYVNEPSIFSKFCSLFVITQSVGANSRDEVSVHVTPRPFEDEAPSASLRGAVDKSVACKFYQRLLLNAWRRSRYQLTTITESFNRQKEQINNLEMQITLLKKLNRSEIQKRDEALLEFQNTKSTLERIQHDNVNLCKNLESFKLGLDNNQKTLKNAEVEIKTFSEKLRSTEMELKEKSKENIKLTKKAEAECLA